MGVAASSADAWRSRRQCPGCPGLALILNHLPSIQLLSVSAPLILQRPACWLFVRPKPWIRLRIQVENFWPVFPSLWGFAAVSKDCLQLEHCHLYTEIKIKWGKRSLGTGHRETRSQSLKITRSTSKNQGNTPRKHQMGWDRSVFPLLICYWSIMRILL